MKKRVKGWLKVLAVSLAGLALMAVVLMGTGMLISREASKTYPIAESFQTLKVEAVRAQVRVVTDGGEPQVEAYAKAWLPEPIDLDQHVAVSVQDGTLTIREIPFEANFLGMFPQPYEMDLTIHVPQAVYDQYQGGRR